MTRSVTPLHPPFGGRSEVASAGPGLVRGSVLSHGEDMARIVVGAVIAALSPVEEGNDLIRDLLLEVRPA